MARVPLTELIFAGTSPVRPAARKSVEIFKRGTSTKITLFAAETGASTVAQPITTDSTGHPVAPGGTTVWVEPGSYDILVGGITQPWEASLGEEETTVFKVFNVKSYGAKGDGATDDSTAIQAAQDAAEAAGGGFVFVPAGTYIIGTTVLQGNKVTFIGVGQRSSILKLKNEAKTGVLKSKRYGEGGENGGIEYPGLMHIGFDGNKTNNVGNEAAVVAIDSIGPYVERVHIQNGFINLQTTMSRNEKSSTRLEDGRFTNLGLIGSEAFNFLFEGPHDSQINHLLSQTNSGVNVSVRKSSEWMKCHSYGNADFAWELQAGALIGCQGEGAKVAQCLLIHDGLTIRNCHFFAAGSNDGKVGLKFGDATHSAFSCRVENTDVEGCINGAYDFTSANAAGSRISGWCTQESGERIKGAPAASIMWDVSWGGTGTTRGGTPEEWSQASAATITIPANKVFFGHPMFMKLTGTQEVSTISALMPGQTLYIKFASTAKLVDNLGNLKLIETISGAENKIVQLVCDGTNWLQVAPAAAN